MTDKRIYYVYVIFRPNGEPCYVGKGKGGRWKDHVRNARNPHLRNIYAKADGDLPIVKIRYGITEQQAFEVEAALIAALRRESDGGPLVNLTTGGDGVSGLVHTESTRKMMSEKSKERWLDPSKRKAVLAAQAAGKATLEFSVKRSAASKLSWADETKRRKMAEIKHAQIENDPEYRLKISTNTRRAMATDEVKARHSAGQKARFQRPEELARLSEIRKGKSDSPETRAKKSAALRGRKVSAESRAKMSAWQIGRKMSDEARAKMSAAAKLRCASPEEKIRLANVGKVGSLSRWNSS